MIRDEKKLLFRRGDLAAILLVLLLAGALLWAFLASDRGSAVEIAVEDRVVATLPLSRDTAYDVESGGYHLTVCVEDGEAFVTDADCPDLVCVHTGKISAKGASVVCAAARVSVRIVGGGDTDADYVAG